MSSASGPAFSSITEQPRTGTKLEKWEDKHVRLLIECYLKYKGLGKQPGHTKKLFDRIGEEFNSISDVVVTGDQCLRKWKKLESKQKEIEDNNSKTGREKKTWKFHKEMEDCLGDNPSVKPVFTFESSSSSSSTRSSSPNLSQINQDLNSDSASDCEEGEGCNSRQRPKRKRKSRSPASEMIDLLKEYGNKQEKIEEEKLNVLKEMQEEKKQFFSQLFSFLKDSKKQ